MARCQARGRRTALMKRGDIWLVGLDRTLSHEQKGQCSVLIAGGVVTTNRCCSLRSAPRSRSRRARREEAGKRS
jgi:mRNA-degrading endonuclease toxin of MazEF toxin-antitoxin module